MLSLKTLYQNICQEDCFTSVDLQDAYFNRSLSCAQEISEIRISKYIIRVCENSLWPLPSTENFYQKFRGGSYSVKEYGSQSLVLSRRPARVCTVSAPSCGQYKYTGISSGETLMVPLGQLRMREFQNCATSQGICSKSHLSLTRMHERSPPLENYIISQNRTSSASGLFKESGADRCLPHGLGSCVRMQNSSRCLVSGTEGRTHTFSRATDSISGSETFCAISQKSSRIGQKGQYNDDSLYKSAGRLTLSQTSHVSEEADNVK